MSSPGGGWGEFFRSFLQAFLRSASKRSGADRPQAPARPSSRTTSSRPKPRGAEPSGGTRAPRPGSGTNAATGPRPAAGEPSPGQFGSGATRDLTAQEARGLHSSYSPNADGDPDPGEVVWTWVPYVENDGRGKDRPVLIIARLDDGATAGCYLSTKFHRGFVSVGTGGWDSEGRESFLSPERLLRVTAEGMRREGHVLDREVFERAVAVVSREYGFTVS
ncbi:hypothetical protein JD292_04265 [Leucobacter sp. CSA2]|uniref:Type II toxin-antitoxin system PemK/MazF family toxin n=1 Tax=Leucobacter edaphi TaxID=2796472 RepID=A0A934UW49_9MICO|nr:hypothetical protein [Leucobacter edaphi]MBK0421294.1 hypothetical protein [Leucobacter edaphi]